MALTNYGDLKTAIGDWMYDASPVDTNAADIVTLAQGYINRHLRCREMITVSDLTISSGVFALPSDYLQWRHVVEKASVRQPLTFVTMQEADEIYPDRPAGLGYHFTIIGSNIRVYPTPSNDIELTYYARLGAFADDSATDWLLTKMPNLYLSAGLMYAAEFLKDDAEAAKHKMATDLYISILEGEDQMNTLANTGAHIEGCAP